MACSITVGGSCRWYPGYCRNSLRTVVARPCSSRQAARWSPPDRYKPALAAAAECTGAVAGNRGCDNQGLVNDVLWRGCRILGAPCRFRRNAGGGRSSSHIVRPSLPSWSQRRQHRKRRSRPPHRRPPGSRPTSAYERLGRDSLARFSSALLRPLACCAAGGAPTAIVAGRGSLAAAPPHRCVPLAAARLGFPHCIVLLRGSIGPLSPAAGGTPTPYALCIVADAACMSAAAVEAEPFAVDIATPRPH